jgi:hypothetical protein
VNGVMVCGEVVNMLWDNIAGFDSLELVNTYETIIYDGGDSTLPSMERIRGWSRGGVGMAARFESSIKDYISNIVEQS